MSEPAKIAIVIHFYYEELLGELVHFIQNVPCCFDLIFTTPLKSKKRAILKTFPDATVYVCENRGMDIGPFIDLFRRHDMAQYDLICKIHTKKTGHRWDGQYLREGNLNALLGSPQKVSSLLRLFEEDEVGMIGWKQSYDQSSMGSNEKQYNEICGKLGIENLDLNFFAGTMFWAKTDIFLPIVETNYDIKSFEKSVASFDYADREYRVWHEEYQNYFCWKNETLYSLHNGAIVDGSLAHAFERVFGALARHQGYNLVSVE